MPNTNSASKALRVSNRKRIINLAKKNKIDNSRRTINKLVKLGEASAKDFTQAMSNYFSALDKAVKSNFIPKGRANRLKSRMTIKIKALTGEDKYETAGVKQEKAKTAKPKAEKKVVAKKTVAKKDTEEKPKVKKTATKAAKKAE
jgi:ribosomal protein S20